MPRLCDSHTASLVLSPRTAVTRREWIAASGMALASAASAAAIDSPQARSEEPAAPLTGRIKQSVVHWCFNPLDAETVAREAARIGLKSVELVDPSHWPMLKRFGLTCAIASSHGFTRGLNNPAHHAECLEKLETAIEASAAGGCPSVITFSGMREGLTDEEGQKNMVEGLKRIVGLAEKRKITLCIEPLNTRVDVEMKGHPGYQCDTVEWAVPVCDRIGSDRVKILYDIYHQQIMQGDLIVRIKQFKDYIGHYHTAGVPGRSELDLPQQEINYPAVMQAILETGYTGFVGQEFIPTQEDKLATLARAARICDV